MNRTPLLKGKCLFVKDLRNCDRLDVNFVDRSESMVELSVTPVELENAEM